MANFKGLLIILIGILFFVGCPKGKSEKSFEDLKVHLTKNDSTMKINPMVEAFAGLVEDPVKKQEMIDGAKARYLEMNIKEIYLVSGATAESNETIIGSLIHFNNALTLDEAKAQLAKEASLKGKETEIFMNGSFAFAVATMNGKRTTPKSVITDFKSF